MNCQSVSVGLPAEALFLSRLLHPQGRGLPARIRRRSLGCRGSHVRKFPSGEKLTPKLGFLRQSRTKVPLRREIDAEARACDGIPKCALRREFGAGGRTSYVNAARTCPLAAENRQNQDYRSPLSWTNGANACRAGAVEFFSAMRPTCRRPHRLRHRRQRGPNRHRTSRGCSSARVCDARGQTR